MSADLTFRKSSYSAHSQNCVEVAAFPDFRKSSYSAQDQNCVEVASSDYRKSSHSAQDQDCIEVADSSHAVAIRDSKHAEAGHLAFSSTEWDAFLRGAKTGGF
ncbi:DUF397 domain-containing protein [Nocardiopsis sp. CNT-189]|uniref:DUF397 domain-containing protein n=1 Tax=Nocardiopsis oceanisediminis TaxID=2816862 RepID=UPI003B327320